MKIERGLNDGERILDLLTHLRCFLIVNIMFTALYEQLYWVVLSFAKATLLDRTKAN